MDKVIEKSLEKKDFATEAEMKAFISEMQSKITTYEKILYEQDKVDAKHLKMIKVWRSKLLQILKESKELPITENAEEKEGFEALKLMNKQVDLADTNQKILDKSTLKVLSLDYSSKELENAILETTKKFEKSFSKERSEGRRLIAMFIVFIGVCLSIIFDKIYMRLR